MKRSTLFFGVVVLLTILLAACQDAEPVPTFVPTASLSDSANNTAVSPNATNGAANTPLVMPTDTAVPPTPTPSPPLAALVNDQPIYLAAYEKELARYEQAATQPGFTLEENYRKIVLNVLIEQVLVEQAAVAQGFEVTPEMVAQEIETYRGEGNYEAWLLANLYTEEEFSEVVRQTMLIQQMIAFVTADVPQTAEQIHARYIHVNDLALANELLTRAQGGDDFAFLADQFSLEPGNGGDMGWFARGFLTVPELEAPAFALQTPGDLSEVITVTQSDGTPTYYLLQLVEKDSARPLGADSRNLLLEAARDNWLAGLWQDARIEQFVDTES